MRTVTRLLLTGLLVTATATACSIEDQQGEPRCIDGNTANLVAQSVPTAELVPCFDPLPNGWDVETTRIDQDGTTIRFRSDRAGDDAAVLHYTASCEVGDAVAAISEHAGARRFEFVEEVAPRFRARLGGEAGVIELQALRHAPAAGSHTLVR